MEFYTLVKMMGNDRPTRTFELFTSQKDAEQAKKERVKYFPFYRVVKGTFEENTYKDEHGFTRWK